MGYTKNHTEITSETKEIVAGYTDVVGFFSAVGITVANPDQAFTIIVRKNPTTGGDQDVVLGEMTSGQKLVIQFTEVTGPVTIP
jgi:hypothetical protein